LLVAFSLFALQLLDEICAKDGIPPPSYALHTATSIEQGKEVNLFMYKVK
jgi:hypothetical protein